MTMHRALTILALLLLSVPLFVRAAADCEHTISTSCGKTPTAVFDKSGMIWVAFEQDQHIYVSRSADQGQNFTAAVAVTSVPESVYAKGENRPKIVMGRGGEIFVSWTKKTAGRFAGEIRFSRSIDGGETFSEPLTVNDDGLDTSHRFDALQVTRSGLVYLVWLDKRDMVKSAQEGKDYSGAAVYYAVSSDGGASFSPNKRVAAHSCECCRIAITEHGESEVAIMWRHIYPQSTRDHAFAILAPEGARAVARATVDEWEVNACPHHGPDIAASEDFSSYHMVWFSNGDLHKGIYYDRFNVQAGSGTEPMAIDVRPGASHPQVGVSGASVYVAWKFFDGRSATLLEMHSDDFGVSWSKPANVLKTEGESDHPILLQHGERLYVAWQSVEEGYRIVPLNK